MSFLNLLSVFVITSLSLLALKPVAGKVGLIDIPGGRKEHKAPTPLVGGVGIYFGTLFICLFTPVVLAHYAIMLMLSALVLMVGIFDDARELRVSVRMGAHGLAALLMVVIAGNQLTSLGDILGFGPVALGILAIPITVFATVGVINAVNMTDGVDGLSGGLVVIALVFLGIVAFESGNMPMLQFTTLLICALLAFLMLNFRLPWKQCALVYMGDAGSTMLGFMLTWLIIEATQGANPAMAPVYALWFLAIPLIDTVSLLIKRPLQGRSAFAAGTDHLHHRLLRAGYSRKQAVLGLYTAGAVMGSIGLAGYLTQTSEAAMFLLFMIIFSVYMAWGKIYQKFNSARSANSVR
jgi:UDP-GlcNAc:undecaprenyl-phosphate GlcNAc-1-phosphate transferase